MQKPKTNRLAGEKSPYLLLHATNPVDWYPWGEEPFEKARAENRPVFLSIGYSSCHWCHVMERESFEDEEVARLLNAAFICVKVDREERPDIDRAYMDAAVLMTGRGGWPLTIFATPDGRPFYAATYVPRESRFGVPGMLDLLPRIAETWRDRRGDVLRTAGRVASAVSEEVPSGERDPGQGDLEATYRQLAARYDAEHGGFGTAPKFPTPHHLLFLLRHWRRTGASGALEMVEATLRSMRRGGIFDHVGFGFHRYSTDERWHLPHFEKMLCDQAMLAIAYAEASLATGDQAYARIAREILTYTVDDLAAPDGGFAAAEDADSRGVEGGFYLWTTDELADVLSDAELELLGSVFEIADEGNVRDEATGRLTGANVLDGVSGGERIAWEAVRRKLLEARSRRKRPFRDDKVLTDWNGLAVAALAIAARSLREPDYAAAAAETADFVLERLRDGDGRLLHRYREGEAAVPANSGDYAFLAWGLLELHQTTQEPRYLAGALKLHEELAARFRAESGALYYVADDVEAPLGRGVELTDGALPSANSVAMMNLVRLARLTGSSRLDDEAAAIARAFAGVLGDNTSAATFFQCALDLAVGPSTEILIVGARDDPATRALLDVPRSLYLPRATVLLRDPVWSGSLDALAPWSARHRPAGGEPTAFVCRGFACEAPTTDPSALARMLDGSTDR